ncbi:hypothetical protein N7465_007251 [Penicillium sp. CMV-2018d]|nr:hypothetical protein N7465_007251 [Penicillium sp. CMV-2018d]
MPHKGQGRGRVAHFMNNIPKIYDRLPLLPTELDIIVLRPADTAGQPSLRRQFCRDFPPYVSCLRNGARGNVFEEQSWSCATAIIAGSSSRMTGLRSNSFDSKSCRWKTARHVSEPRSVPK